MGIQIVMDHTGDSRFEVDIADAKSLEAAEARFDRLLAEGYTAAIKTPAGPILTRKFDSAAQETLFYPRLVGG